MIMTTIGIKNSDLSIKEHIISELKSLQSLDFDIVCEDHIAGDTFFIKCGFKKGLLAVSKDKKKHENLIYSISVVLADTIVNNYEKKLLKKIIKEYCLYQTDYEKIQIFRHALGVIKKESCSNGTFYKQTRKSRMIRRIMDYLKTEDIIIIDGFVNFRLNDYMNELRFIVEKAIEEFITEREYKEFIRLLRYFVEIQEPKIETIHIIALKDKKYLLLDREKMVIDYDYYEDFKSDFIGGEINYGDILISNLITLAPREIIIHNVKGFDNKEIIQTICNVFYDRTEICKGCEICELESLNAYDKLN